MGNYSTLTMWLEVWKWPLQPQVGASLLVVVALYVRGMQVSMQFGDGNSYPGCIRRLVMFLCGVVVLFVALQSPVDGLSNYSFAWHMVQHMLLMLVVPPLWVNSRPLQLWRRGVESLARVDLSWLSSATAPITRLLGNPKLAIGGFAVVLWTAHIPSVYDFALMHQLFHESEHLVFLMSGIIYFSQVIDSGFGFAPTSYARRIVYLGIGIGICWILGVALAFSVGPLYRPYLVLPGSSLHGVLTDQVLGAAIMWAPGMIPFDVLLTLYIQKWLSGVALADLESAGERISTLNPAPAEQGSR